jgi:hypothetical protein
MDRTRPGKRDHLDGLPPGAERFWGQFAETRAGRTSCQDDSGAGPNGREPAPDADHRCLEWCPICRSAELAGLAGTPDLLEYFQAIQGDLVTILRAFMDAYVERVAEAAPEASAPDGETDPRASGGGRSADQD